MGMKKRGPGCPCECNESPCPERCAFPCVGDNCPPICYLDIQMPIPDTRPIVDSLIYQGEQCENWSAPCYICYDFFDRQLNLQEEIFYGTCNNWNKSFNLRTRQRRLNYSYIDDIGEVDLGHGVACWDYYSINCPYGLPDIEIPDPPPPFLPPCFSAGSDVFLTDLPPPGQRDGGESLVRLEFSGNEWNGECGKLTIVIKYTAANQEPEGFQPIPIPPEEGVCYDPEGTWYEHTFELEYCSCEELLLPFTYVGTTSENTCKGVTVDDPCNMSEAVIKLKQEKCSQCSCYNCSVDTDVIFLEVAGPEFNGTITLTHEPEVTGINASDFNCQYRGELEFGDCKFPIIVRIICLQCDRYRADISIGIEYYNGYGITPDAFDCGETAPFNMYPQFFNQAALDCRLDEHTFSLS